ncbi:probable enoyl-CoA hydratase 1, peroxisomal [Tanacetum coccineum]
MNTTSSTETLIQVTKSSNGIAYVTINRPKSLNSLTRPMMTDMAQAFKSLDADPSVGVIILSGSGRAFCSGVDLTSAEDVFKGDVKDVETDPVAQMERCRKVIIGAVSGFAVTAGFEIALACDVLVASSDAKFIDTHARFGIFPSWGLSQKLSRIIGVNKAREVSLTATPLTAETAEKLGFVNYVVERSELLTKAREIGEAIMKNNQDLVLRYKSVINDGIKLDLHHALLLEKERAHEYYDGMTKDQFKKMQEFIAASKELGSLSIGSIFGLNIALLFKWIWRLLRGSTDLWVRVIKDIYGPHGGIDNTSPICYSHSTWGGILSSIRRTQQKGLDLFSFCVRNIGDSASTRFWEDVWCGDQSFKTLFPRIYQLDKNKLSLVKDRLPLQGSCLDFRRLPRGGVEMEQFSALQSKVREVVLSDHGDSWL